MYFDKFTESVNKAVNVAKEAAAAVNVSYIGTEHILYGILSVECVARKILNDFNVTKDKFAGYLKESADPDYDVEGFTPRTKKMIETSIWISIENHQGFVGTEHILLAIIMDEDSAAVSMLIDMGVDLEQLKKRLLISDNSNMKITYGTAADSDYVKHDSHNSEAIDKLSKFGVDLTKKARDGKLDPVIGRTAEIDRIIQILSRRTKNNPVLIGEPGVGKSAIAEGLAIAIENGTVPELLKGKIVFSLDIAGMLAGTKFRGDFEERLKDAISAVQKAGNIIIFIDEIHNIIGAGASTEGKLDAADILKPLLARGELQTIGATTIDEYRKYIEKDAALERRFQPVMVEPPSVDDTILILKGLRDRYEAHHKVTITDSAITAAAELSDRYIADRFLPDKAIDLIDEACSRARLDSYKTPVDIKEKEAELQKLEQEKKAAAATDDFEGAAKIRDKIAKITEYIEVNKKDWKTEKVKENISIKEDDIAKIVSQWTSIPVIKLTQSETKKLINLEQVLHERVIGQDEAVDAVSKAIRRARAGLKDPKRPIGSFIFVGPTGVGKTELGRALAEAIFGDENLMIRVDMSEYMEKHSVSKLIGSPPGYIGYEESGQLTEKIRRKPYSVVLFDEIEKAHPDIFNMLLQILEDGRLTDNKGRSVSFKNTIIIMTSNAGTSEVKKMKRLGFEDANSDKSYDDMKGKLMESLKKEFKPEFLNRIDEIIVFHPLTKTDIASICNVMLKNLTKRLSQNDITVNFTDAAKEHLISEGFDEEYGARPLRRVIQRNVEDKMSEEILKGNIKFGDKVAVDFENGKLIFLPLKDNTGTAKKIISKK